MHYILSIIAALWVTTLTSNQSWPYKNIHILGDSHSPYCFTAHANRIPFHHTPPRHVSLYEISNLTYTINEAERVSAPFFIHWIQGRTMHRIGRDGLNDFNIKTTYNVQENDVVVFMFGAIDIGGHIFRKITRQMLTRDLDEILDTLASNYINTLKTNKNQFEHLTAIVIGVVPPMVYPSMEQEFLSLFPGGIYPDALVNITQKLNKKLEEHCSKSGILYMNINKHYENEHGILRPNLSDGGHHIHPAHNQPIKNDLFNLLLNEATKL